jgi:membrane-associated phospholipid phosphatase
LILLTELILVLFFSALFWAWAASRNPWTILGAGLGRMFLHRSYRTSFLLLVGVIVLDLVESRFDAGITAALGYDLTGWIHAVEGDWAASFQSVEWLPATYFFAFVYIVVLPAEIFAPLVLSAAEEKLQTYRRIALGFVINYAVALPFYFFFPVKEMWAGNPAKVSLLVDRLSPVIMEAYRSNSALNNCFPSLHTSLALTVALALSGTWSRKVTFALWSAAVLVIASTLYLGIHWATDVATGVILALIVSRLVSYAEKATA